MDDVICAIRLPLCCTFGMYVYCNAPEIWVFVTSDTRRSGQCILTSCEHSDIGTPQKKEFYLCANIPVHWSGLLKINLRGQSEPAATNAPFGCSVQWIGYNFFIQHQMGFITVHFFSLPCTFFWGGLFLVVFSRDMTSTLLTFLSS